MMKALYRQKGATLSINIVAEKETLDFIDAHAGILDTAFQKTQMSDAMRSRLQRSTWIFSGMKAIREMGEAFPSLVDENGDRKTFEQFFNDVRKIDETYNRHYLQAEYEFAAASAQMAAKWERFEQDGDRYNLQYRTAGDDRVRPEHAALDGITLPPSDTFWEEYYPPNGWRCRCDVVQVRKAKYPVTPHDEAMRLGQLATETDTKSIFKFNPGKQQRVFPASNNYTSSKCNGCNLGAKESLAKGKELPVAKLCQACKLLHQCYKDRTAKSEYERIQHNKKLYDRLSKDKRYKDVEFNPQNGALKATHVGHNTGKDPGFIFEKKLVDALFNCGHSIILCDEQKKGKDRNKLAALDMILDGVRMDIKSIMENKDYYGWPLFNKNDQLRRFNNRTDIHEKADTLCLYFDDPVMFTPEKITKGYQFLKSKTNDIHLAHVICMINSAKGLQMKSFDFT